MRIASRLTRYAAAVAASMGCMASHAGAAVMVYTDRASYEANITRTGYDRFTGLVAGTVVASPAVRSAGSIGYGVNVIDPLGMDQSQGGDLGYAVDNGAGGSWLSTNFATSYLSFGGFSAPVRGIGGSFFSTDINGAPSDATVSFTVVDASGAFDYVLANGTPGGFLAFVSDSVIESLSVRSGGTVDRFVTVGELTLGTVPEPGSMLLICLGALAFVGRRRVGRI